jgi:hypothetical protein
VTNVNQSYSFELATLNPGESALTIIEDGHGHVEVIPSGNKFTTGDVVTLTAVPDPNQDFLDWSGGASGSENPLRVTMATSKVITANFTKRPRLRVGTVLEGLVEEGFRLTLLGEFGATYSVEGSSNLTEWTEVQKLTIPYGIGQTLDPTGRNSPWRFYRAIEK